MSQQIPSAVPFVSDAGRREPGGAASRAGAQGPGMEPGAGTPFAALLEGAGATDGRMQLRPAGPQAGAGSALTGAASGAGSGSGAPPLSMAEAPAVDGVVVGTTGWSTARPDAGMAPGLSDREKFVEEGGEPLPAEGQGLPAVLEAGTYPEDHTSTLPTPTGVGADTVVTDQAVSVGEVPAPDDESESDPSANPALPPASAPAGSREFQDGTSPRQRIPGQSIPGQPSAASGQPAPDLPPRLPEAIRAAEPPTLPQTLAQTPAQSPAQSSTPVPAPVPVQTAMALTSAIERMAGERAVRGDVLQTLLQHSDTSDAAVPSGAAAQPTAALPATERAIPLLQLHAPLHSSRWGDEVGDRIRWMIGQQMQSAEMKITPPHLGTLDVRISVQKDQMHISFSTPHAQVREAIEDALPRLRELMSGSGFDTVNVDVSQHSSSGQRGPGEGSGAGSVVPGGDEEPGPTVVLTPRSNALLDLYA